MYADENNNRLPILTDSNNLNEISRQIAKILLHNMGVDVNSTKFINESVLFSDNFYCPSNYSQQKNKVKFWNSSDDSRTVGYFFILDAKNKRAPIQGKNYQLKQWVTRLDIPGVPAKELITDIVMSDVVNYKPSKYPLGNFEKIQSKILGVGGFESTSHLINDTKPSGGNIGFYDGHLEWRSFSDMDKRYGDNPVCWW